MSTEEPVETANPKTIEEEILHELVTIREQLVPKKKEAKEKKGFFADFVTFLRRQNLVDVAVGIYIATSISILINEFVDGVVMPIFELLPGIDAESGDTWENLELFGFLRIGNFLSLTFKFIFALLIIYFFIWIFKRRAVKNEEKKIKRHLS